MNRKSFASSLIILLSITACSLSAKSLAIKHLELIESGEDNQANQQYCIPKEPLRLHTVKSFEIVSSNHKKEAVKPFSSEFTNSDNKKYKERSFTEVIAKVETDQFSSIDTSKIITIEVWETESFYQRSIETSDVINDIGKDLVALGGDNPETLSTPDRKDYNKDSMCIFLSFKQFRSDR